MRNRVRNRCSSDDMMMSGCVQWKPKASEKKSAAIYWVTQTREIIGVRRRANVKASNGQIPTRNDLSLHERSSSEQARIPASLEISSEIFVRNFSHRHLNWLLLETPPVGMPYSEQISVPM